MLVNAPETRAALERLVRRLTSHRLWHEDLVQESLIHWWQQECVCPNQSACWYLRSCQFYLQNRLRQGRSVDSLKRRNGPETVCNGEVLNFLEDATPSGSVWQMVVARDLIALLLPSLTRAEQVILGCLLDGLGVRATARRLSLSHTCVVKKRRRIATLFGRLEG